MKKVMIVSDYPVEAPNSIAEILKRLLKINTLASTEKVVCINGNVTQITVSDAVKTYCSYTVNTNDLNSSQNASFSDKLFFGTDRIIRSFAKRYGLVDKYKRIAVRIKMRRIFRREKPDLVLFLIYTPDAFIMELCAKLKIPFMHLLYDTVISRPGIDKPYVLKLEAQAINNGCGYFVPDFFYSEYIKHYEANSIYPYKLPLLIDKTAVLRAYDKREKELQFTYFGQIQSFRNADVISELLCSVGIKLDIYASKPIKGNDVLIVHPGVTGDELYSIVAQSKYLIAFDNSAPYQDYLPSKAYMYVSFTKPVIAFGDNKDSALIRFFKDYPYFYYQNINEPTDGLMAFLSYDIPDLFDEQIYD
ncbi:MAG: hypothetical protein K6G71_08080 [Clostridiales bacterium]|nr:hypothetical protein [Clostridiales bacterium]